MTEREAMEALVRSLEEVAPEVDGGSLDPDLPLQDQIDLDSMDFISFVAGLHGLTGVDVPERDYPRLATLASAAAYLAAGNGGGAAADRSPDDREG